MSDNTPKYPPMPQPGETAPPGYNEAMGMPGGKQYTSGSMPKPEYATHTHTPQYAGPQYAGPQYAGPGGPMPVQTGNVVVVRTGGCPRCHGPMTDEIHPMGVILAVLLYFFIGLFSLLFLLWRESKCLQCGYRY